MASDTGNTEQVGADRQISVSFEFFPPKTPEMEASLWDTVCDLAPIDPSFVSVTYGAGGSTRERTHATVSRIVNEAGLTAAAHLTCVAATRAEIESVARDYWAAGVRHIVALRGDPPEGEPGYTPHPDGYAYAADLVVGLQSVAPFEISVAAYPETHPEAPSADFDIENLKRKTDAGATRAITQFFFDNGAFLRFRDKIAAAGIDIPLVPGIMPVGNFKSMTRFADMCGASMPGSLADAFAGLDDDPAGRVEVGVRVASEQCLELRSHGIDNFHFYTLNRADMTHAICRNLGVADGGSEIKTT
ncbi:MAG: methylenetetrahydrofolate reductase [NAD(P)H] [Rhodospirillaceae bacterium]|mgnify:FL=1|jgi:methylenetetrahydrofolate reductase (NADPH)|nr:methylenetetrahydrofolate reductase [NAD(P)H] [Rhodospirillaceae bacterium]MBT4908381.1 methylenetetrahydrofolate reductase [NAD(P)H] [Rhodospirillaceae bacterium]MBT5944570.1 methylenetetrahydrofolate reductase [NAD(P)H] [Rhodospirillaceae bacterium]MBT6405126.1 methylenetetrahydrofolate reductase [NAD(P)H] [Rhodospirillaceae bacterium]MBT6535924.1 methylenetetrahydrofolate reductase [NAD(P)H] [Rhodospirillaceae bacterium]